jgi:hypothetical protein
MTTPTAGTTPFRLAPSDPVDVNHLITRQGGASYSNYIGWGNYGQRHHALICVLGVTGAQSTGVTVFGGTTTEAGGALIKRAAVQAPYSVPHELSLWSRLKGDKTSDFPMAKFSFDRAGTTTYPYTFGGWASLTVPGVDTINPFVGNPVTHSAYAASFSYTVPVLEPGQFLITTIALQSANLIRTSGSAVGSANEPAQGYSMYTIMSKGTGGSATNSWNMEHGQPYHYAAISYIVQGQQLSAVHHEDDDYPWPSGARRTAAEAGYLLTPTLTRQLTQLDLTGVVGDVPALRTRNTPPRLFTGLDMVGPVYGIDGRAPVKANVGQLWPK